MNQPDNADILIKFPTDLWNKVVSTAMAHHRDPVDEIIYRLTESLGCDIQVTTKTTLIKPDKA